MKILIVGASSFIGFGIYSRLKTIKKYLITGTYFRNKKDDEVAEAKIYVESPGFFEISQFLYENKEPIAIFIAMIFGDIDINGI